MPTHNLIQIQIQIQLNDIVDQECKYIRIQDYNNESCVHVSQFVNGQNWQTIKSIYNSILLQRLYNDFSVNFINDFFISFTKNLTLSKLQQTIICENVVILILWSLNSKLFLLILYKLIRCFCKEMTDKSRVFYSLLERVGTEGKYQNITLIFWSLIYLTIGASTFFNPFLFYSQKYQCPNSITGNCHDYVCSLPAQDRLAFIQQQFQSIATEFGDYRCQSSVQIDKIQTFIYIGGIIGVISGAFLSQMMSKRKLMIITVVANIIGIGLTIISPTLFIAGIGLFINFAAKCIQTEVVTCYITETTSQTRRGQDIMVIYFFYALGVTFNGLIFMLLDSWQIILLIYQILPFIIMMGGLVFHIQETPFDLITGYEPEYACSVFERIALLNGRQDDHAITVQQLTCIKAEYEQNERSKHDYRISFADLVRFKSLRSMTFIFCCVRFLLTFEFNVPELVLEDYAMDIHINGIIIGSSQIFASIFCYFFINSFQRKNAIYVTSLLGIAVSLPVFLFASCKDSQNCPQSLQLIQTVGLFLYRAIGTTTWNYCYMAQFEMLPTQIRSLALQILGVANNTAVVMTPAIKSFFENVGVSIIITFVMACLLMILIIMNIPQTYKTLPPEMIEELKYEHHDPNQTRKDSLKQQHQL